MSMLAYFQQCIVSPICSCNTCNWELSVFFNGNWLGIVTLPDFPNILTTPKAATFWSEHPHRLDDWMLTLYSVAKIDTKADRLITELLH